MPYPDTGAGRPAVGAARANQMGGIPNPNAGMAAGMRGAAQQYGQNQMRGFNDQMGGVEDEVYDEGYEDYDMMGMAGQQGYDEYNQGYGMPNQRPANPQPKAEFMAPARPQVPQGYGNPAGASAMAGVMMNQGTDLLTEPFTMEGSLNSQTFDRKPGFDRTRKKIHEREKMREAVQKSKQSGAAAQTTANGAQDNNSQNKQGQGKKKASEGVAVNEGLYGGWLHQRRIQEESQMAEREETTRMPDKT